MSEAYKSGHESHEKALDTKELQERQNELLRESQEKAEKAKNSHAENLKNIREQIEKEATSSKEKPAEGEQKSEPDATNTYWYSKEYRELAFKQLMGKVRHHLTPTERVASKLIHQPIIEKVSEVSGKTVARPSGVLMGSIFSFIASFFTYFFAKQNGYDMTYSIFAVSFLGGFLLGIVVEFTFRGVRSLLSRD